MVSGQGQFARLGPYLVTADQVDPDNCEDRMPRQRRIATIIAHR
jgi:hypothetical protein